MIFVSRIHWWWPEPMYQKLFRPYVRFVCVGMYASASVSLARFTTKTWSKTQNVFRIRLLRLTSFCNWWIKREMCVISTVKISCLFSLFCFYMYLCLSVIQGDGKISPRYSNVKKSSYFHHFKFLLEPKKGATTNFSKINKIITEHK